MIGFSLCSREKEKTVFSFAPMLKPTLLLTKNGVLDTFAVDFCSAKRSSSHKEKHMGVSWVFVASLVFSLCLGLVLGMTFSRKTLFKMNIVPPVIGVLALIFLDSPMRFNFNELGLIFAAIILLIVLALAAIGMLVGSYIARLTKRGRRELAGARKATSITIGVFLLYLAIYGAMSGFLWSCVSLTGSPRCFSVLPTDIFGYHIPPFVVLTILVTWVFFAVKGKTTAKEV